MTFLQEHLPSVLVGLAVLAIVAFAVWRMYVNKKRGSNCAGCSQGCGGCPHDKAENR